MCSVQAGSITLIAAMVFSIVYAVATTDKMYAKIEQRLSKLARANNVSDEQIVIRELHTFVSDDGLRRRGDGPAPRRGRPAERALNLKALELMRQALYSVQARIRDLEPMLARFKDDMSFRMPFILNRLKQLAIDLRRIYTLAARKLRAWRALDLLRWYAHAARKYVDVLHVAERAAQLHGGFVRPLAVELRPVLDAAEQDRGP